MGSASTHWRTGTWGMTTCHRAHLKSLHQQPFNIRRRHFWDHTGLWQFELQETSNFY
jgi:uncharacterized protein YcfL